MSRDTNWMCGGCGYITTDPDTHDCSCDDEELSKEDERYTSLSNDLGHVMRDVKLLKKYNDSHCVRLDAIKSQMIILEKNIKANIEIMTEHIKFHHTAPCKIKDGHEADAKRYYGGVCL